MLRGSDRHSVLLCANLDLGPSKECFVCVKFVFYCIIIFFIHVLKNRLTTVVESAFEKLFGEKQTNKQTKTFNESH